MIASQATDALVTRLFESLDTNCLGRLTVSESELLLAAIGGLGFNADLAKFYQTDAFKEKYLSLPDLLQFVGERRSIYAGPEDLKFAFQLFDRRKKGYFQRDDVVDVSQEVLGRKLHRKQLHFFMKTFDENGDDFVTEEEFYNGCNIGAPKKQEGEDDARLGLIKPLISLASNDDDADDMKASIASSASVREESPKASTTQPPLPQSSSSAVAATHTKKTATAPLKVEKAATTSPALSASAQELDDEAQEELCTIAGVRVCFRGGKLSRQQAWAALTNFGYDQQTLNAEGFANTFNEVDSDSDGFITKDEYCKMLVGLGEDVEGY